MQEDQDLPIFEHHELFELPLEDRMTIVEIKAILLELYNKKRFEDEEFAKKFPPAEFIRVREKSGSMLGKVLKNTSTLSQIHAYDKKNITFEILGEEEQQKEDELLTYVRLFKPSD